ncbi:unnamed protein product [Effrenium voratum]|nr:unnamed protein product [Effrenium voratum]
MCTGALQEDKIDTVTPDETCVDFLQKSLHAGCADKDADEEDGSDADDDIETDKTCFSMFSGLCRNSPHVLTVCKLVKVFNRALLDNNVKVGNLLHFTTSTESFLGFLGVCLQRPHMHTLVKARLNQSGAICIFGGDAEGHRPDVITSHALFQQLVTSLRPLDPVNVEVLDYTITWAHGHITLEAMAPLKEFKLDAQQKLSVRKPRCKLPFGLKMPQNPRKQRKPRKAALKPKGSKRREATDRQEVDRNADLPDGSDSDSSSDSILPTLRPDDLDTPPTDNLIQEQEASPLCPVSKESRDEEIAAKKLLQEHEATTMPTMEPAVQGGSYFTKNVGLHEVGLAASGRAKCFFCKDVILKGTVRFSWYHNRLKPSAWVHSDCLPLLAAREKGLQQVVQRLEELSNTYPGLASASSSSLGDANVIAEALRVTAAKLATK